MKNLSDYGIKLRYNSVGNQKLTCPQCSHKRKNKHDLCLSVTVNQDGSSVWKCHNCEWSGGINNDNKNYSKNIKIVPKPLNKPEITNKPYKFFQDRGISNKTVDDFEIYEKSFYFGDGIKKSIVFPYYENKTIVNNKYRSYDKDFRQEKDAKRTLYNIDRVKKFWSENSKYVLFVEGEMDVLSFYECGIQYVISLPDGAPKEAKFQKDDKRFQALNNAQWLHEAERIIIAVDSDDAGNALHLELVHRFGKDKCWVIDWSDYSGFGDVEIKDANEYLVTHGKEALLEIVTKYVKPYPVHGIFTVKDYNTEIKNIYNGNISKPVSTGFENLDQIYKVMPSTFTLVTGVPNHGKSNFLDQLLVNLTEKQKWKFLIFSPEHSTANHIRRLSEKIIRKPFDIGPNERMNKDDLQRAIQFLDEKFYFIESKENIPSIEWILNRAKQACFKYGIHGIVIDPYNEIDSSRNINKREDEHIRDLIAQCKKFARTHEVAFWMVAHPAKMQRTQEGVIPVPTLYDVSGSAHWNNMCDVGLVVHRDFETNQTRIITRKVREQGLYGHIGECFFKYDLSTHTYKEDNSNTNSNNFYWQQD